MGWAELGWIRLSRIELEQRSSLPPFLFVVLFLFRPILFTILRSVLLHSAMLQYYVTLQLVPLFVASCFLFRDKLNRAWYPVHKTLSGIVHFASHVSDSGFFREPSCYPSGGDSYDSFFFLGGGQLPRPVVFFVPSSSIEL